MTDPLSIPVDEFKRIQEEIRQIQKEIQNDDGSVTEEQKMEQIWKCIPTHTPEQILRMILTIDPDNADKILLHPSLPNELRSQLDDLSIKWSGPMKAERQRVQEETKRADIIIEQRRQQTRMVQDLNRMMEGQVGMYRELNNQING